jgi:acyl-coenzyme A thioesterase PaaI-like protein
VSFLSPARPGKLVGEGRVIQLGKSIAFLEGSLTDAAGTLIARATASARLVEAEKALG